MSHWETLIAQRTWFGKVGLVLFGVGIVLAVVQPWIKLTVPFAVVPALLAIQCFLAHNSLNAIVRLQAALDMKRMALDSTGGRH